MEEPAAKKNFRWRKRILPTGARPEQPRPNPTCRQRQMQSGDGGLGPHRRSRTRTSPARTRGAGGYSRLDAAHPEWTDWGLACSTTAPSSTVPNGIPRPLYLAFLGELRNNPRFTTTSFYDNFGYQSRRTLPRCFFIGVSQLRILVLSSSSCVGAVCILVSVVSVVSTSSE